MAFWNRNAPTINELEEQLNDGIDRIGERLKEQRTLLEDIRLKSGTETTTPSHVQTAMRKFRRQSPGTLSWQSGRGITSVRGENADYRGPVHNLGEIAKAIDVESYFARAIQRHRELCMKNGWRIVGRDQQRVRYITRRINEIMMISDTTFGQVLRESFNNLFSYANHQIVLKRDPLRSSGGKIRLHGRTHEPISGLYPADPITMSVKQSRSGLTERWRQSMGTYGFTGSGQKDKFFRPTDVVHLFVDRKTGFIFGTPYVIPVLDDMRLLRRLEELVDIIAHKHAFPLLVVKIGTEKKPADEVMMPGGSMIPEVDIAQGKMEDLDFEGGVVVTERYDIQFVGAENKAIDLKPYLEHLESRVLGGLRLSDIDLGRGDSANRNTAQSITQTLVDACTDVQRIVEETFSWKLFFPLLMEGDFKVDLSRPEEDMVYLDFAPIDTAEQRQQEVHALEQYQGNLITETEARRHCGRQPIGDAERKELVLDKVTKPTSEMESKAKAAQAASKATTTSKSRPTNQHGTKAKPRISKNRRDTLEVQFREQIRYHYQMASDAFLGGVTLRPGEDPDIGDGWKNTSKPKYVKGKGSLVDFQASRLIHHLRSAEAGILIESRTYLTPLIELGFDTAVGPQNAAPDYVSRDELDLFFRKHVRDSFKDTLKSSVGVMRLWGIGRPPQALSMRSNLEVHGLDLMDCASRQAKLAYAYGFQLGTRAVGSNAILVSHEDGAKCPRAGSKLVPVEQDLNRLVCIRRHCRMNYGVAGK